MCILSAFLHSRFMLFALLGVLIVNSPAIAQESSAPASTKATTISDAAIPVDHLQVILRPRTKEELEIESQGWLELLRAQIREVSDTELELKTLAEGDSADRLQEQLVALRTEEFARAERARVVLHVLKSTGGDVADAAI